MPLEPLLISQYVAAAAMLLLAAWLLWLNFNATVNRAFAAFLLFRAMVTILNRIKAVADDAGDVAGGLFWAAQRDYYFLALAPALLYFWVAYANFARRTLWQAIILVGALAVEGAYLVDHALLRSTSPDGEVLGPLHLLTVPAANLVMGGVGFWILHESFRVPRQPRRQAAFPVAAGFLMNAALEASLAFALLLRRGWSVTLDSYAPSVWVMPSHVLLLLGLVFPLLALASMTRTALARPALRTKAKLLGTFMLLAIATGLGIGWRAQLGVNWLPGIFLLGLWRTLLPALVVYALVRHRLFGVDVRLKWTLNRATVAFVFLGVFFVAGELAQNYFSDTFGWSLGGIVAGLLLFAISPLQRMAERFSQAVLPHAQPVATMAHAERLAFFRDQATLVWSDGTMGRKERALLDSLRLQLHLPPEDALRIEAEAAQAGIRVPPSRAQPTK